MTTIDNQTLLHIGVECVVIGGLTYWQHRKIENVREEVNELKEKLEKYEEIINSQGQLLMQHEQYFRGISRSSMRPPSHPSPPPPPPEEPDVSNEELDRMLASELETLEMSADGESADFEEVCSEDACPVDFKKKKQE